MTAEILQRPDKTVTIYMRDPDTNIDTLFSRNTYTYDKEVIIEAPVAPYRNYIFKMVRRY